MNRLFHPFSCVIAFSIAACVAPVEPTSSSLVAEGEGEGEGELDLGDDDNDDASSGNEGEGEAGECESEVIDAPAGGSCDASTLTCIDGCGEEDEDCYESCLTSDPGGESCSDCLDDAFLSCVNSAGCQPEFDAIVCCSESCADPDADACYTDTCAGESEAYDACIENQSQCFEADAVCFAS